MSRTTDEQERKQGDNYEGKRTTDAHADRYSGTNVNAASLEFPDRTGSNTLAQIVLAFAVFAANAAGKAPAATGKVFVFHGKIQAVDTSARTLTLQSGNRTYVFAVSGETRIVDNGATHNFAYLKRGQYAEVEMKVGPGGNGVALSVTLVPVSTSLVQSIFAATTPSGRTLSAEQIKPLILSAVLPARMGTNSKWHLKVGVFLLAVRSDGGVARVETLQSTRHVGLDAEIVKALMKWRFRPDSVKEVRVPAYYFQTR